jgi:hypothetical protein
MSKLHEARLKLRGELEATPALRRFGSGWISGVLGLVLVTSVHSAPIVVTNHSFELPAIPAGTFATTSVPPGWSVYGNGINFGNRTVGVLHPNTTTLYIEPMPTGQNVGVIFLMDNPGNQTQFAWIEAGMRQTPATTLQSLTRYTLTVEVGNIANDVNAPFLFGGFPNYRIDLLAGTNVLASDNNTLLPGEGRFLTSTVTVSTTNNHSLAGQPLGIRLVNLNSAPGIEVNFDNVRLDASPVPVPTVITGLSISNGNVILSISNLTIGATNILARSIDFSGWTSLTTFIGQSAATNVTDTAPLPERAHYRIETR